MEHDEYLDAKGLNCPLPVLKAKLILHRMSAGRVLLVDATDPHSSIDFEAYCARTRHELLCCEEHQGVYSIYIRRAEMPSAF